MSDQRTQVLDRRHRAREDLKRYRATLREAQRAREGVAYLQSQAERTSKPMDPNKVQVQSRNDGPEILLCKIADMQQESARLDRRAECVCRVIKGRIDRVGSEVYRGLLSGHWVYGLSLAQLACVEGYSLSHVKRLHGEALDAYEQFL